MKRVFWLLLTFFPFVLLVPWMLKIPLPSLFERKNVAFYAYPEFAADHFNKECILCTESKDYEATIAFTKHWKITLWRNQAYLGRCLLIAKRHFGSYEEMNDEEAQEYRQILKTLLPALKKTFNATHFNVAYLMNQAYREEKPDPHFHWHVIPRYEGKRQFAEEEFEDPDFGNSFVFDRKQYVDSNFQKALICAIRKNLKITYQKIKKNPIRCRSDTRG